MVEHAIEQLLPVSHEHSARVSHLLGKIAAATSVLGLVFFADAAKLLVGDVWLGQ